MREYGIDKFQFEIVEECLIEQLNEREQYWIEFYNSFFEGYNMCFGSYYTYTEEQLIKSTKIIQQQNLLQKNENHPRAKLSNEEVLYIRERYKTGLSLLELFQDYQEIYNFSSFKKLVYGESYRTLDKIPIDEIRYTNAKLTKDQVLEIRRLYKEGNITQTNLGKQYNLSQTAVGKIIRKETYKHIE